TEASMAYNARHTREQLVASRATNGRVCAGDCYMHIKPKKLRIEKILKYRSLILMRPLYLYKPHLAMQMDYKETSLPSFDVAN
ncbi:hypothetical protein, partial [Arsukibacterium sp. UBA3155]|uniref:hypothetical protein n=1 Tax=Arsukibacterium sp. UBA3155 TaxID=1946058 RepID=UPI0025C0B85C